MSIETEKKNQSVQVDIEEVKSQAQALVVQNKDGEEIKRAQIVDQPTTTKWEVLMYALYYFGNNATGPYTFTPTQYQNLLSQSGWIKGKRNVSCSDDPNGLCVVSFAGTVKTVNSVVLINLGIGFALQSVVFLFLGGLSDYGQYGSWVLIGLSIMSWGVQFGFLGVHDGRKHEAAFALSVLSSLGYQGCQSFWTAMFPRLARNLPKTRAAEEKMLNGEILESEYHKVDSYYRNKITNYSFAFSMFGFTLVCAISIGILKSMDSTANQANNNWAMSVCIMFATIWWIVFGTPWFFAEKKRINEKLPEGVSYLSLPFKQLGYAFKSFLKLKQTALYLFSYWLLGDGLNTAISLQSTIQNEVISYDMVTSMYLNIVNGVTSVIGVVMFWWIQKTFKISTRNMYIVCSVFITLFPIYGLIGMWTNRIGFHNIWEEWFYNAYSGIFIAPYYAYSSTMMSEVCPRGREFVFFAIFSTINKTSSFIGPFVSSAIIDDTGNNNSGFSFLVGICCVSLASSFFLNQDKARVQAEEFLIEEKRRIANGESLIF